MQLITFTSNTFTPAVRTERGCLCGHIKWLFTRSIVSPGWPRRLDNEARCSFCIVSSSCWCSGDYRPNVHQSLSHRLLFGRSYFSVNIRVAIIDWYTCYFHTDYCTTCRRMVDKLYSFLIVLITFFHRKCVYSNVKRFTCFTLLLFQIKLWTNKVSFDFKHIIEDVFLFYSFRLFVKMFIDDIKDNPIVPSWVVWIWCDPRELESFWFNF